MSLQFQASIHCDGKDCLSLIEGKTEHRATYAKRPYWDALDTAAKNGWLTLSRGRYRTEKHFCPKCADKAP